MAAGPPTTARAMRTQQRASVETPLMGTRCYCALPVSAPPVDQLVSQLEGLEAMWLRFRPGAELSRLGAGNGRPTLVLAPHVDAAGTAIRN